MHFRGRWFPRSAIFRGAGVQRLGFCSMLVVVRRIDAGAPDLRLISRQHRNRHSVDFADDLERQARWTINADKRHAVISG